MKAQLVPLSIMEIIIILKLKCHLTFLQMHTLKNSQNVSSVDNDTKGLIPLPSDDSMWNYTATLEHSMGVIPQIKLSCHMS